MRPYESRFRPTGTPTKNAATLFYGKIAWLRLLF
nr:MAG TPA: hypothetical protein [Caudoviricetes sp.]